MDTWSGTPYEKAVHDGLDAAGFSGVTNRQASAILDGLNAAGLLPNADVDSAALRELRAEFAEAHADRASSNGVVQMLDDFLTKRGLKTVLYQ